VFIPSLCVSASSKHQPVAPIASLTKMMTTWVILHAMPLSYNQTGPCRTISASDVAQYKHDVATGQSRVAVLLGERLCEGQLLRGVLVHSAGNFTALLREMMGWSQSRFVATMNVDARRLGLRHTHYVDLTGILPQDRSTASDQAKMAVDLMTNEPIVDRIVQLPDVRLPVAGTVGSYTPYVGQYGVIGVKSGFTDPAGGCDVMAVKVTIDHVNLITYAVVLGQNGADPLGVAGNAALNLSRSMKSALKAVKTTTGTLVEWAGSKSDVIAASRS
jgi:D-alanyl-D-alanine carboxypeptidase (penicillin-binding protein 5/6)